MAGSAWKVAYADFMTALMAFFLMMWVINMVPPEKKEEIAQFFQQEAMLPGSAAIISANNASINRVTSLDLSVNLSEAEKSNYAIAQKLRAMLMADSVPQNASGLSADDVGVQLRVNNDAMFSSGSAEITGAGKKVMDSVLSILREYNVYMVVRGHADTSEMTDSLYPSPWELSAARAASAVHYLVDQSIKPTRMRAVAYGDTRPLEPGQTVESRSRNRRVEFHFHRPEAMSYSIVY